MVIHCCKAVCGTEIKLLLIWQKRAEPLRAHTHSAHTRTHICHPPRRPVPWQALWPLGGTALGGRALLPSHSPAGSQPRRRLRREPREAAPPGPAAAAPAARAAPLPPARREGRTAPRGGKREGRLPGAEGGKEGQTDGRLSPTRSRPPPLTRCRCRRCGRSEAAEPWGSGGRGRGRRGAGGGGSAPCGAAPPPALRSHRPGAVLPAILALPCGELWGRVGVAMPCPALPGPLSPRRARVKFFPRHGRL